MHPESGTSAPSTVGKHELPRLRAHGSAVQLVVDGAPFLILGGELGNSTASSLESLSAVWPRVVAMGLNTLLLPVYWELIEPREGEFDFTLVAAALTGARAHGLRLVLLWFGSWKNSMSTYVPGWVKADRRRFPFAERANGHRLEILSAFGEENVRADARAFSALMRHLAIVDGHEHTVIMVQVENEVGMLDEAADRSMPARAAFAQAVPTALLPPGKKGTWREAFGDEADEAFMAYHFARYVDRVASAGKAEHPLPMFVNAALNRPGRVAGEYPSGGPLPHLFELWRSAAPAIDFLAPDIYFPSFVDWCRAYARPGNPLFIPEIANDPAAASEVFYAIGRHDALGFSPFAIDTISDRSAAALKASYGLLRELAPLVLRSQGTGRIGGAIVDSQNPISEIHLGGTVLSVRHDYTFEWSGPERNTLPWPRSGALIVETGPRQYLVVGHGVIVTFADERREESLGLLLVDEGRMMSGQFVTVRRLNGDETHQGRHLRIPFGTFAVQRAETYAY